MILRDNPIVRDSPDGNPFLTAGSPTTSMQFGGKKRYSTGDFGLKENPTGSIAVASINTTTSTALKKHFMAPTATSASRNLNPPQKVVFKELSTNSTIPISPNSSKIHSMYGGTAYYGSETSSKDGASGSRPNSSRGPSERDGINREISKEYNPTFSGPASKLSAHGGPGGSDSHDSRYTHPGLQGVDSHNMLADRFTQFQRYGFSTARFDPRFTTTSMYDVHSPYHRFNSEAVHSRMNSEAVGARSSRLAGRGSKSMVDIEKLVNRMNDPNSKLYQGEMKNITRRVRARAKQKRKENVMARREFNDNGGYSPQQRLQAVKNKMELNDERKMMNKGLHLGNYSALARKKCKYFREKYPTATPAVILEFIKPNLYEDLPIDIDPDTMKVDFPKHPQRPEDKERFKRHSEFVRSRWQHACIMAVEEAFSKPSYKKAGTQLVKDGLQEWEQMPVKKPPCYWDVEYWDCRYSF